MGHRVAALVGRPPCRRPRHGHQGIPPPLAGDLTLDWDTLVCASDPDQQLVTWTAEPATPSHDGLRMLAS